MCDLIARGLERKLTLVSAPAGYGKTSALVDFAQHNSVPVCWYTADERDRDLSVFVAYLVGAINEQFPGFAERLHPTLDSLSGDLFHDPTSAVGVLVNEILEIDTPFAIVMDNYEALDTASNIRTFVHRLLEVLPSNCHLMLGSRVLPDVPITHLVAKRQLVGLTDQDLRFDPNEIQELLRLSQIEVSESQAEAIVANSEGWITGILLLADLLREETKAVLLDGGKATAKTYNYLASEVLNRQPPDIQHFLRTSAVLREMSPRLCHEVLQIKEPHALLAEVERRNLFVTRFGRGGTATYRYHNLFRDFLHEQLRQRDPARYTELHLRAARQFEQDSGVEETVYHYLAAQSYPDAIVLMERVAMEWFTRGRIEALLRWAETLPEEVRVQAPRLSLYQSRALTDRCAYAQARQALAHAEAGFADRGDMTYSALVHDQRAALALLEGRHEDAIAEAQAALGMLGQDEAAKRAGAQRLIGRAYVGLGRFSEGIAQLQDALALFRRVGGPYNVVNLLRDLVSPLTAQGRLDEAATCLSEALVIGRRLGAPTLLAGVLNSLGCLHYDRGGYRRALALYEEGLAAARRGSDLRHQAYISVGMADIYRDVGAYRRAASLYSVGWRIAQESELSLAIYILVAQVDMYRWRGDHVRAYSLLEQARQLAQEKGLDFEERGLLPLAEGITLAESGELEAGLRLLSSAAHFLEQQQAMRELARARFLLAKVHLLAEDKPQAIGELRRALALADEIGTDQFAVVEGQHAEGLLGLGVAKGVAVCKAIIEKIEHLKAFGEEQTRPVSKVEEDAVSRLEIYGLGEERVVRDGQPVHPSEWQAAMAKELFFYILLHGSLERDIIGLVFWPDLPARKMRNSFHTTLHRVRHAVGADAVVAEDGQYRLGDVDYWFDVEEFEALIERARLLPPQDWQAEDLRRRAAALYQGDFLPEVERVWCVPKREALREMYLRALIEIGQCHERRKEFEMAIGWYRRALEVDELREGVHRRVMYCYSKSGRRSDALAQYSRCRETLRQEIDVEPSAETKRLYEQIAGKRIK